MARIEKIIGRQREMNELDQILSYDEAAFVVVYGRRRVGKTFLVNNYFADKYAFKCTGISKKGKEDQLQNFAACLNRYSKGETFVTPKTWYEAFNSLRALLEKTKSTGKQVVFIDELPWMDSRGSNLVPALENFWNDWGCTQSNLVFIVCGSATSWITKKILKNHGGLHNRADHRIFIHPFTLCETRQYLQSRGVVMGDKEIAECYMIMGGIPFYLKQIQRGKSLAQNIDEIFFCKNGRLEGEYDELYASLYNTPAPYLSVVEALGTKNRGLTKEEIVAVTGMQNNGHLKEVLDNLDRCDIIRRYSSYEKQVKHSIFQLIDPFTLFHLRFICKVAKSDKEVWIHQLDSARYRTWTGLAFEQLCLLHHLQIEHKLQIAGIQTEVFAWQTQKDADEHAQIDLIIKRRDKVINVCEMKYYDDEYIFKKKDAEDLQRRIRIFKESCGIRDAIHPILVTTYGLRQNEYSSLVQRVVTLEDLMKI